MTGSPTSKMSLVLDVGFVMRPLTPRVVFHCPLLAVWVLNSLSLLGGMSIHGVAQCEPSVSELPRSRCFRTLTVSAALQLRWRGSEYR